MAGRTYDNFDILIEAAEAGVFRARVTNCSAGDTPAMNFSLPFPDLELENLLLKLNPARAGTRRILDPHTQASVDLGAGLFDAVFQGEILLAWIRSTDSARERQHGLRLRLRLADAPALAGLPWEFLYDRKKRRFFAQSDRTPVVRYLDVGDPPRPLAVRGPLRILVVIASPHDLPALDVEREWSRIHEVLAEKERLGLVVVNRLPYPSLGELQRWLRLHEVHVLHFVGHGDFDGRTGEGLLAFCDQHGRSSPVTAVQLGAHVRDHDPLRLVVLNACRTATTDNLDSFSGMAQGLIQQEAAAVVAMQFPISDGAAITFTTDFYGAMADGEPVDQAMASARKALLTDFGEEWATPVLFLRAADGRIFDHIERRPPTPPRQQPPRREPPASDPAGQTAIISRRQLAAVGAPPSTTSSAPPEPTRRRRRWIIAAVAAAVAVPTAVTVAIVQHRGTPAAGSGLGSGQRTSTRSQPPAAGSTTAGYYLLTGQVRTMSGPSSTAYRHLATRQAGFEVRPVCAVYGENFPAPTGRPDPLWYWTADGWINDYYIQTPGQTMAPVTGRCTGNVESPTVDSQSPSSSTGPFALIGGTGTTEYSGPSTTYLPSGSLAKDALVTITCHQSGEPILAKANSGGTDSADWDQLSPGQWIPNAYLLTGNGADSPAKAFCPTPSPSPSSS